MHRFVQLAAAADFHSKLQPAPTRKCAKSMVELDRAAAMAEAGYHVRLGKLPPEAKSPKDDLIWGWHQHHPADSQLRAISSWGHEATTVGGDFVRCGLWHPRTTGVAAAVGTEEIASVLLPDATEPERAAMLSVLGQVIRACTRARIRTPQSSSVMNTVFDVSSRAGDGRARWRRRCGHECRGCDAQCGKARTAGGIPAAQAAAQGLSGATQAGEQDGQASLECAGGRDAAAGGRRRCRPR